MKLEAVNTLLSFGLLVAGLYLLSPHQASTDSHHSRRVYVEPQPVAKLFHDKPLKTQPNVKPKPTRAQKASVDNSKGSMQAGPSRPSSAGVHADRYAPWWQTDRHSTEYAQLKAEVDEHHRVTSDGERFLLWGGSANNGFNNQREQMHVAFICAYALNRTLVLSNFRQHRSGEGNAPFTEFMDAAALGQGIPFVQIDKFDGPTKDSAARAAFVNPRGRFTIDQFVMGNKGKSDQKYLAALVNYGYVESMYEFNGHWRGLFDHLWRYHLRYTDEIFEAAVGLIKVFMSKRKEQVYHAVHMRVGDRKPVPLLDCEKAGMTETSDQHRNCVHDDGSDVKQEEVIPKVLAGHSSKMLFIATNDAKHKSVATFRTALAAQSIETITFKEVIAMDDKAKALIEGLNGVQLSCVDQIICAYAEHFFPTCPSSWDELVVAVRRWVTPARPGASEQAKLFFDKVRRIMSKRYRNI